MEPFVWLPWFRKGPGGEVACVGLYSDRTTIWSSGVSGSFYMRLNDDSSEVALSNYFPFDEEFLSRLLTERQVEREADVHNADIRALHFLDDDSVILLGEIGNAYISTTTFTTQTVSYSGDYKVTTTTETTYHTPTYENNSIIVMRLSAEGAPMWATTIPKSQTSQNDGGVYLSFAHAFVGDKTLILYNDDPQNIGKSLEEVSNPFAKRNAWGSWANVDFALVGAIVDSDGRIVQEVLHHPPEDRDRFLLIPDQSHQTGESELTICGDSPGSRIWGRIRLRP